LKVEANANSVARRDQKKQHLTHSMFASLFAKLREARAFGGWVMRPLSVRLDGSRSKAETQEID
jgi:hypothetical protein